ncbi:MAG TPA: hypothetical protein DCQ06_02605, partial [Myxococcales bacterium]|nr:hypothetical protein [Myxococcales bacterium]
PDEQIEAMLQMLEIEPNDELTTVRLGRLMLAQKHAQDCQKLLTGGKKRGMKSVAFEVALVELWLWSNRNDDALSEIKEATQRYPKSVDLLFIRGQVEEQQKHTTTAGDFYAQVIERQPDHLRAALRLSELKARLGRHEDAYQILAQAHSKLGDLPTILEPLARELMALKRLKEARAIFAVLLEQLPNHRGHLLNAARMDLKAGQVDRALKYLKILRDDGVLDQEGAVQMAKALASKGNATDAAETLVSFADRSPNDIRINALCGQYMLNSGDLTRAETLLKRAYKVAQRQGGDAETMFQYGRLAFKKHEVSNAVMRMQEAIKAAPTAHQYRYSFAVSLLKPKVMAEEGVGQLAESNLRFIIDYAPRYAAANNEVDYLADVYRKLAGYYFRTQRAAMAIPLLNQSLSLEPKDVQTKVMLGSALYQVNSPEAQPVLQAILRIQPNNHEAALYLGMTLLNAQKTTEAMKWLQRAVAGKSPKVIEAWYHLALIYRDRRQGQRSKAALKTFIAGTKPDHPLREDAISQYNNLR